MTTEEADAFVSGKATKAVLAAILADETMAQADIIAVLRALDRRYARKAEKRSPGAKPDG